MEPVVKKELRLSGLYQKRILKNDSVYLFSMQNLIHYSTQPVLIRITESRWDHLIITADQHKLEMRDPVTGRSDAILFSNINGLHGYLYWDWTNPLTPCNSHKLSKGGGVQEDTIIEVMKYLNADKENLVLSRGYHQILEIDPDLDVIGIQTTSALLKYNTKVRKGESVVAFIHMTC